MAPSSGLSCLRTIYHFPNVAFQSENFNLEIHVERLPKFVMAGEWFLGQTLPEDQFFNDNLFSNFGDLGQNIRKYVAS